MSLFVWMTLLDFQKTKYIFYSLTNCDSATFVCSWSKPIFQWLDVLSFVCPAVNQFAGMNTSTESHFKALCHLHNKLVCPFIIDEFITLLSHLRAQNNTEPTEHRTRKVSERFPIKLPVMPDWVHYWKSISHEGEMRMKETRLYLSAHFKSDCFNVGITKETSSHSKKSL